MECHDSITEDGQHKYQKTKGFATMDGQNYEVKLAALLFLRGMKSGLPFQLATNVEGIGALDDIVFRFLAPNAIWHTCFVQLKHKKSAKLNRDLLLSPKGDFSLAKYFESYLDIKQKFTCCNSDVLFEGTFESCHFVIFSNAPFHQGKGGVKIVDSCSPVDKFLLMGLGENSGLSEDLVDSVYEQLMQNRPMKEDEAKDFLSRVKLFAGQPSESQLDDIIKRDLLETCCSKSSVDVDSFYQNFRKAFEQWWKNSDGIVLDQNSTVLIQALYQAQIDAMIPQQKKEITLPVKFCTNSFSKVMEDCIRWQGVVNIVTDTVRITASKVMDYLDTQKNSYLFVGLESVVTERDALLSAWKHGKKHLLVVATQDLQNKRIKKDMFMDLLQVVQENPEKQLIILSLPDFLGSQLKSMIENNVYVLHDVFHFSQLSQECIECILKKEVIFQGATTTISSLFGDDLDVLTNELKSDLDSVITSEQLVIGSELGPALNYFVPRTFKWKRTVKKKLLSDPHCYENILICGATLKDAHALLPIEELGFHKPVHEVNSGLLFSAHDQCIADNCEISDYYNNTHILELVEGKLYWKESRGDINVIKSHIDDHVSTTMQCVDDRVCLLIAEPGMGKSTLATHLALQTKKSHPHIWVVCLALSDHTKLLADVGRGIGNAKKFLESALGINEMSHFDQILFHHNFNKTGNFAVYLDGCDEIAPKYEQQCCALLKSLVMSKVKKIFVTSRSSMKDTLESHLSTLAVTLLKFSESDQSTFLSNYWKSCTNLSNEELQLFITELLRLKAKSMKDERNLFTGIPLQTLMLAEVFMDHVNNKQNVVLPDKIDVIQLIEQFVDKKLHFYVQKQFHISETSASYDEAIEELRIPFLRKHQAAALVLIYGEKELQTLHSKKLVQQANTFFEKISQGKDRTGIVDKMANGSPVFLHRVFAEYFAARWFSKKYAKNRKCIHWFLLGSLRSNIRLMFNLILAGNKRLHVAVLNDDFQLVETLLRSGTDINEQDCGGRTALHLAVAAGFQYPDNDPRRKVIPYVELLLKNKARCDIPDDVTQKTCVQCADGDAMWPEIDMLLKYGNVAASEFKSITSLTRDDFNVFEYENVIDKIISLDCSTVYDLIYESPSVFSKKSKIPIHERPEGNLLKALNLREQFLKMACYGSVGVARTMLERAAQKKKTDEVARLPATGQLTVDELVSTENAYGDSALQLAVRKGNTSFVKLILDHFTDISLREKCVNKCDSGCSALFQACLFGDVEMIELLISAGANVTETGVRGCTMLMHAALNDRVSVVKMLLDSFTESKSKIDYINLRNNDGETALEIAKKYNYDEIVGLLEAAGSTL